jgi:hypothetical protein
MNKSFSALAILFVARAPIYAQVADPPNSNTIAWKGHNFYLYGVNDPWVNYGLDFGGQPVVLVGLFGFCGPTDSANESIPGKQFFEVGRSS